MDEVVRDVSGTRCWSDEAAPGMPAEAPGAMPSQTLASFDQPNRAAELRGRRRRGQGARRLLVLGASAALAAFATNEMRLALSVSHMTSLAVVVLILFTVNVCWISLPCVTSLAGFFRVVGRRAGAPDRGAPLSTRTALLMPTHDEDPARVAAALESMAHDLLRCGEGRAFDIFLLSDSTRGHVALAEEEAVWALRRRLGGAIGVYYRRRDRNIAHKAGNVRDFCERWGRRYDHLLILDADSLMDGATMVRLARRMEADPRAGLIQTLPRLHNGTTLLARLHQFAASVYGPLLGSGFAWWTMDEATFWGHNAIVRTEAFMACAGLPVLPGAPPFGGPILSHDFVEAALIRRGGWAVSIADDLEGSYEECPSSLADQATRDRRWCQGNLQHVRVLSAKGLRWPSRLHLAAGVMSYLSSPIWLLFVLSALALGVQYEFAREQYFAHTPSLFPLWPRIDPARALRLFTFTMAILFAPKVLGWLSVVVRPRRLRDAGGVLRLTAGVAVETLLSALIAPVVGLIHCGILADVLRGRDSGWRAQRRDGGSLPWRTALHGHRWHMLAGVALGVVAYAISWQMLAWLAPAVVGMVVAAPVSKLVASAAVGLRMQRAGLLRTPEETRVPRVARAARAYHRGYREAVARAPDLAELIADERLLKRHLALTVRAPPRPRADVDAVEAIAEKKIRDARDLGEAVATLTQEERARVLASPPLLQILRGQSIERGAQATGREAPAGSERAAGHEAAAERGRARAEPEAPLPSVSLGPDPA